MGGMVLFLDRINFIFNIINIIFKIKKKLLKALRFGLFLIYQISGKDNITVIFKLRNEN